MPWSPAWREGGGLRGEIEPADNPTVLRETHRSVCATPGETAGRRHRMAADAAAIAPRAWSIPSGPGKAETREPGIEGLGEGDDRPRAFPDPPSGTGRALSGPVSPGFAGRRVRHGTCTESRRYAVIDRSTGATAAFRCTAPRDAGASGWRAYRSSRRTVSDVRSGGVHAEQGVEGSGPGNRRRRRASHFPAPGRP